MTTRLALKKEAAPWGLLTSLDLYQCNPSTIRSAEKIRQYIFELCDLIQMRRYGECQVVYFGEDERVQGYSVVQLIETSLISGHFANLTNAAYIDIFSCKSYEPEEAVRFTQDYFEATSVEIHTVKRM